MKGMKVKVDLKFQIKQREEWEEYPCGGKYYMPNFRHIEI